MIDGLVFNANFSNISAIWWREQIRYNQSRIIMGSYKTHFLFILSYIQTFSHISMYNIYDYQVFCMQTAYLGKGILYSGILRGKCVSDIRV